MSQGGSNDIGSCGREGPRAGARAAIHVAIGELVDEELGAHMTFRSRKYPAKKLPYLYYTCPVEGCNAKATFVFDEDEDIGILT